MVWNLRNDCFKFNCLFSNENPEKLTRRTILSVYSRIFDPLSFILQFILQPKLLIQELSRLGLLWDEEVPQYIKKNWGIWLSGISSISKF